MRIFTTCLLLSLISFSCRVAPKLPDHTNSFIEKHRNEVRENVFMGVRDSCFNNGFRIAFESIGDPSHPTILLIMGFETSGLAWSERFIQPLLDQNYHVIRYDNRDTGKSDFAKNWRKKNAYTLNDMAADAVAILDKMNIQKAHVAGMSMGGMIGQEMAIHYPERVASLSSMMSSAHYFDRKTKTVTLKVARLVAGMRLKYGTGKNFEKAVKNKARTLSFFQNKEMVSDEMLLDMIHVYNFAEKENYKGSPDAAKHHAYAIRKAPSRMEGLKELTIPVMILHGTKDELIIARHAENMVAALPEAKMVYIENMGHVPTRKEENEMAEELLDFLKEFGF